MCVSINVLLLSNFSFSILLANSQAEPNLSTSGHLLCQGHISRHSIPFRVKGENPGLSEHLWARGCSNESSWFPSHYLSLPRSASKAGTLAHQEQLAHPVLTNPNRRNVGSPEILLGAEPFRYNQSAERRHGHTPPFPATNQHLTHLADLTDPGRGPFPFYSQTFVSPQSRH